MCDPRQKLRGGDFQDVLEECAEQVSKVMLQEQRTELAYDDREFIAQHVWKMVKSYLKQYGQERTRPRFRRGERVVCKVGGERKWAGGIITTVDQADPEDVTGCSALPYIVKVDPPQVRLISVSKDDYDICRAEVCFGQRAGAMWFTLFCLPARSSVSKRRFASGERVACAVEDETNDYSVWAAGTVVDVNCSIAHEAKDLGWGGSVAIVPYRVLLDSGCHVLVHRDEHWLVRDLALQAAGPRQVPKGAKSAGCCLTRLERRHKGDYTFEAIDHSTRRVRPCPPPEASSDEGEHDDDCLCGRPSCCSPASCHSEIDM